MSRLEEIEKLLRIHESHLGFLKEKVAEFGTLHTPTHILVEIERRESEIAELETERAELQGSKVVIDIEIEPKNVQDKFSREKIEAARRACAAILEISVDGVNIKFLFDYKV